MSDRHLGTAEVNEIGKCQRKLPGEMEFIRLAAKGLGKHERKPKPGGGYEWTFTYKPNENGTLTKAALEVQDLMLPGIKADVERHSALEEKRDRVALRDKDGGVHYVEPELAEQTASQTGWSHRWRAGGIRVELGTQGGMLFRRVKHGWEPTGRSQVGILGKRVSKRGIYFDPSGMPWRWVSGRWRSL